MKPISAEQMAKRAKVGAKPRFSVLEVYALRLAYDEGASVRSLRRRTGANHATVVAALRGEGAYKDI